MSMTLELTHATQAERIAAMQAIHADYSQQGVALDEAHADLARTLAGERDDLRQQQQQAEAAIQQALAQGDGAALAAAKARRSLLPVELARRTLAEREAEIALATQHEAVDRALTQALGLVWVEEQEHWRTLEGQHAQLLNLFNQATSQGWRTSDPLLAQRRVQARTAAHTALTQALAAATT